MSDANSTPKEDLRYHLQNSEKYSTQEDFARALNVHAGTLSRYLSGASEWPPSSFRRACDLLKLNDAQRTQLWESISAQRKKYLKRRPIKPKPLPRSELSGLTRELVEYYTEIITDQKKRGIKDYVNANLHPIMDNLVKCFEEQEWQATRDLALAIDDFLKDRVCWTERLTANEKGSKAAHKLGDYHCECIFLDNLGRTWDVLGKEDKAITVFGEALGISDKINDLIRKSEIKSRILDHRGSVHRHKGQIQEAIEDYTNALTISSNKEINDLRGQETSLCSLGRIYTEIGRVEKAIEYIERALGIARKLQDRHRESIDLGYLGDAYMAKWKAEKTKESVEKAREYYEAALEIAEERDDLRGHAKQLLCVGNAHRELGQVEQARGSCLTGLRVNEAGDQEPQ